MRGIIASDGCGWPGTGWVMPRTYVSTFVSIRSYRTYNNTWCGREKNIDWAFGSLAQATLLWHFLTASMTLVCVIIRSEWVSEWVSELPGSATFQAKSRTECRIRNSWLSGVTKGRLLCSAIVKFGWLLEFTPTTKTVSHEREWPE